MKSFQTVKTFISKLKAKNDLFIKKMGLIFFKKLYSELTIKVIEA